MPRLSAARSLLPRRAFSTCSPSLAGQTGPQVSRAIVYASHGDPTQVLKGHTYTLPALEKGSVRLRYELSAISESLWGDAESRRADRVRADPADVVSPEDWRGLGGGALTCWGTSRM